MSSFLLGSLVLNFNFEYIAYTYLVIYFGAILTLFLVVVMLLDMDRVYIMEFYLSTNVSFLFVIFVKVIHAIILFYKDYLKYYQGVFTELMSTIEEAEAKFSVADSTYQLYLALFNFYGP